ncbi:glycosyltransferase involved in cell wall biosynthesis [Paraburkholderia caballeronis]|uniref:glycosyltransferase n=1 Tax=Paraburkholderia caballeronis TaxID=416943 RepID=UPI0010E9560D|nr:glycosyltransferase [Paraburkholderia caballeronis]TDV36884.1 glycosyltransferase involved in cell wall biosynthesis [Paraburkholderia caballeronis]
MKILHLVSTVDPRSGGPIEGVRQSGLAMTSLGHQIEVASLDPIDAPYVRDFPLPLHALGPGRGHYGYSADYLPWLRAEAPRFDAAIVHGLWQYHGLGARRALRDANVPYYVYAHGMLDPWFRRTYPVKHLKKWAYWPWAEYRVLRDAAAVIFTTEEERRLARESFWLYRANERVVPFGASAPPASADALRDAFLQTSPHLQNKRIVLFLGRLHPKKGCDMLIHAFAEHARETPDAHLLMAGPDPAHWQPALQAIAQSHGIAHRISWPGMLQGDLKWGAFYASDVFVLPSHQENFGVAVAEALACGLPVLVSDKVNVWREIDSDHAGFVAPDTIAGTQQMLASWRALDDSARHAMRAQARRTFDARFAVEGMVKALLALLHEHPSNADARSRAERAMRTASARN